MSRWGNAPNGCYRRVDKDLTALIERGETTGRWWWVVYRERGPISQWIAAGQEIYLVDAQSMARAAMDEARR